jgi:drug/metabolite transporter (DMT)-like permease
MRRSDFLILVSLGAIWGVAFPLTRYTAPYFGPFPLIAFRMALGAGVLFILLRRFVSLRELAPRLLIVGLLNNAVPQTLFAYAALHITAGFAALINSTTPMFGALLGLWLGERLSLSRALGVLLGFAGVATIVWDSIDTVGNSALIGGGAALAGSALYAVAAAYTRRNLGGADPGTIACGSLLGAFIVLLAPATWQWPEVNPPVTAWMGAVIMGLVCTAAGNALYFRLLRNVGVSRATTVTFLVPVFGIFWGAVMLGEEFTLALAVSCAIVLLGTALATGMVRFGSQ